MNQRSPLESISPVDGRYAGQTLELGNYFSELALFKYRIKVEIEYFIALCASGAGKLQPLSVSQCEGLRNLYVDFSLSEALKVKSLEKQTNHDIKAVEYYIKDAFSEHFPELEKEYVHFGLTSQDINNTAIPLSLKEGYQLVIKPAIDQVIFRLNQLADEWQKVPMLARTHGQPASPTSIGKEIRVFCERLEIQMNLAESTVWAAKFGGATGNLNAHRVAFPQTNWVAFANDFVASLGLHRSKTTTQIEHYDQLAAFFHNMIRVSTILIDLSRDIWSYISIEYFRQKVVEGETGSSAMPHKVNPIDFENAEGNLGVAIAIMEHFAVKLPISRMQRDLTDSTVLRNIGVPLAHMLISLKSITKGLNKLNLNEEAIRVDLDKHASVVAEAIQTILRRESYPQPYEALKAFTRGKGSLSMEDIRSFIDSLDISDTLRLELHQVKPENYTGYSFEM
ncbi:MAG: adenylosuccinate lyase [Bacteroidetes bacterium]|nr:adenylosuccinate lyase [Bacteroidota bacterium]